MNLANLLARAARTFPDRLALACGERALATYAQLGDRSARIATGLRTAHGLRAGDRLALLMTNDPAYVELVWGAWWAGLAVVPINAKLHPKEAAYILDHSGARVCAVTEDLAAVMAPALALVGSPACDTVVAGSPEYEALCRGSAADIEPRAPEDLAWLFYTSGTTGRPKGVMLTHRNLLSMTLAYFADVDSIAPGDCLVHAAPMSHGSGLYGLPHVAAAAAQVIPESGGFDPAEIFALGRVHRGMTLFAAPTMVKRLVEHARAAAPSLDGIKTIVYGGGPMYLADIKDALAVMGPRFVQIYGQGESPMTITALSRHHLTDAAHPRHEARLASVGVAQSVVEVRIADEHGRTVPADAVGEVLVRGDVVMAGYWQNADATAATLRGGWLHTGDVGVLDPDGFLTLKDRSKDLIISGGANIYPREVEEVLLRHPAVLEASVVGRPDPEWGEEVVAFVVARPDGAVTPDELERLCLDHIARFKRPREYRFVESLPKNNYGKVLKTELRERLGRER